MRDYIKRVIKPKRKCSRQEQRCPISKRRNLWFGNGLMLIMIWVTLRKICMRSFSVCWIILNIDRFVQRVENESENSHLPIMVIWHIARKNARNQRKVLNWRYWKWQTKYLRDTINKYKLIWNGWFWVGVNLNGFYNKIKIITICYWT